MKIQKGKIVVAIGIVFVMVCFDQITKKAIESSIPLYGSIEIIHRFFYLTYLQNTGAGFSILEGAGVVVFALITFAILCTLIHFFMTMDDVRYQTCFSFIFAGATGNLMDRLRFGYVRDFFGFYIFGNPFPVFNIADICITVGFAVLIACAIYDDYKEKKIWRQNT